MGQPAWTGLGPAQTKGRACVICAQSLSKRWGNQPLPAAVMVGRCSAGSPVFACAGVCASRAVALAQLRGAARAGNGGERR